MSTIPSESRVASPCISVCEMDAATGLCAGCLRTLDEIATWSVLDDAEKRAVLARLPLRRARVVNRSAADAER
jgi:predicted Fe-S protein YdhL (DUF1289 family)